MQVLPIDLGGVHPGSIIGNSIEQLLSFSTLKAQELLEIVVCGPSLVLSSENPLTDVRENVEKASATAIFGFASLRDGKAGNASGVAFVEEVSLFHFRIPNEIHGPRFSV